MKTAATFAIFILQTQEQKPMSTNLMETSTKEICCLLLENGFNHSVTSVFCNNKVDGAVFMELDKDDIK